MRRPATSVCAQPAFGVVVMKPHVGDSREHGCGHGHMSIFLAIIPFYVRRVNPQSLQVHVREQPSPRPCLAIDKDNVLPPEVLESPDPFRVSLRHQQPLFTVYKVHQHDPFLREDFFDVAHVVLSRFFIEQVRARKVRLTALERKEPAHAADMRRRE